jgi:hypothetical protein
VNGEMLRPSQFDQVLRSVIKRILVDMVDDSALSPRTVCTLPNDNGSFSPDVRLIDLDEGSPIPAALMSYADADRANGKFVMSDSARLKLSSGRVVSPNIDPVQGIVQLARTAPRAAVRTADFCTFPSERRGANRACQCDGHVPTIRHSQVHSPPDTHIRTINGQQDLFGPAV